MLIAGDETGTFQMLEVPTDGGGKLKIAYIVLQGAPDVIDVHDGSGYLSQKSRVPPLPRARQSRRLRRRKAA